jgi:hypothetical protein
VEDNEEYSTTLIRVGNEAATFREMVEFADMLEQRPVLKLLEDLPGLALMSEAKFNLATQILRRRFRHEAEVDRAQLITFANEIADSAHTAEASERIRHIFADA